jgi:drug/metabolite transporter (DMT)-like permease
MLGRPLRAAGLVLLGSAWVVLWSIPAFASEGNESPEPWYYVVLAAGPFAVALRAYSVGRRSSRSRSRSTATAIGLAVAALVAGPLVFGLLIWGLNGFSS